MKRSIVWWMMMGLAGCNGIDGDQIADDPVEELDDGKYEAWNYANNPAYVDSTFTYDLTTLPVKGRAKDHPWAGDYWAVYKDSINVRWDGESSESPAEKVAKAFNLPDFAKYVTERNGIYGHGRKACNTDTDCDDQKDGSKCVTPRGKTGDKVGRCIPTWWGICHGWAPASVAEPRPAKSVTKNGVTFYPGDVEALASYAYQTALPTKFLSQRCNKKGEDAKKDANGRLLDGECRDMNAGSLYIVLSNLLGLRGQGLVYDRTYHWEVWNQPIESFEVTNAVGGKLLEISKADAVAKLGLGLNYTNVFTSAVIKQGEKKTGVYAATADGELIVKTSGSGDGDLYVKKGAAATETVWDCRPYAGGSDEECRLVVKAGDQIHYMIHGYSDATVTLVVGKADGAANYTYNTDAKRFFYVEMDVRYITESRPSRSATDPTSYVRTDSYQMILEADAAGKALGGEWIGESMETHPDFAWWPSGKPASNQGGFSYAMAKELIDGAKAATAGPTVEEKVLRKDFSMTTSLAFNDQSVALGVPGGAKVEIIMTGDGNADLYVRLGTRPTIYTHLAKATGPGSNHTITFTAPAAGGTYWVRSRPMATSRVTVIAKITK